MENQKTPLLAQSPNVAFIPYNSNDTLQQLQLNNDQHSSDFMKASLQNPESDDPYYYNDESFDSDYGFIIDKYTPRWRVWLLYTTGILLILTIIIPFLYFSLSYNSGFIEVPDLIRVKKVHVLTNITGNDLDYLGSTKKKHNDKFPTKKRIILVGDVHGNVNELKQLMHKVSFNPVDDELVLLGDFISKGPDSIDVLDYAIENNASCIRGNHEDSILFAYTNVRHLPNPKVEPVSKYEDDDETFDTLELDDGSEDGPQDGTTDYNNYTPSKIKDSDVKIARALTDKHIEYIGSCPLIIDLGYVSKEKTHVVGVHAGLHWDIKKLYKQSPMDVMTMRSLLKPDYKKASETSEGRQWSKVWNTEQLAKPVHKRVSVFYGHDARHGLNVRDYTFGIDSNCVGGGKLTAMVITKLDDGSFDHTLSSVKCLGV